MLLVSFVLSGITLSFIVGFDDTSISFGSVEGTDLSLLCVYYILLYTKRRDLSIAS